uniref:Uncharacterized protein n=1 Tax=Mycena chlorophos TaxID=658473 RepID=A0ABQ0LIV0_MYCCL|nr:predicted protein [Mycena chlorophos]
MPFCARSPAPAAALDTTVRSLRVVACIAQYSKSSGPQPETTTTFAVATGSYTSSFFHTTPCCAVFHPRFLPPPPLNAVIPEPYFTSASPLPRLALLRLPAMPSSVFLAPPAPSFPTLNAVIVSFTYYSSFPYPTSRTLLPSFETTVGHGRTQFQVCGVKWTRDEAVDIGGFAWEFVPHRHGAQLIRPAGDAGVVGRKGDCAGLALAGRGSASRGNTKPQRRLMLGRSNPTTARLVLQPDCTTTL